MSRRQRKRRVGNSCSLPHDSTRTVFLSFLLTLDVISLRELVICGCIDFCEVDGSMQSSSRLLIDRSKRLAMAAPAGNNSNSSTHNRTSEQQLEQGCSQEERTEGRDQSSVRRPARGDERQLSFVFAQSIKRGKMHRVPIHTISCLRRLSYHGA